MKKFTGKIAKSKAKAAPLKIGCDGHWIEGNIWFNLGLSKTEAMMLKAIAGDIFTKSAKSAAVARVLLQAALAHYDVMKPLIQRNAAYSADEGFFMMDCYLKGVIAGQHAKIAERKRKVAS